MPEKRKAKRSSPKTVLRLPDRGIGCIRLTLKSGRSADGILAMIANPLRSLRLSNDSMSSRCHPKKSDSEGLLIDVKFLTFD
jgi:hypothetical protein